MKRAWALAIIASLAVWTGQARALLVTYDLGSNQGPITLRFEADDEDADTRLRFRQGQADISSLLDVTLTLNGTEFSLIGAVDPDAGLLDTRQQTIGFTVADVVRPFANTLTTVNLTFSERMRRLRTLGDLFAYLDRATVAGGALTINAAAPIPLPGGALLLLTGLVGLAARRASFSSTY